MHGFDGHVSQVWVLICVCVLSCSVMLILCNSMDRGAWQALTVHGILQAGVLECVAISSSRESS